VGRSSGAGHPHTLRCAKCKIGRWPRGGTDTDLEATGKTRPLYYRRGFSHTARIGKQCVQYRCRTCGHVGWTQHMDGDRLTKRGGEASLSRREKA